MNLTQLFDPRTEGTEELALINHSSYVENISLEHHEQISCAGTYPALLIDLWGSSETKSGRGSLCTSELAETPNTNAILKRVVQDIGRPFSICCQWRAEKPKDIMSS